MSQDVSLQSEQSGQKSLWDNPHLFDEAVDVAHQLTLGEGNTELEGIDAEDNLDVRIYLKREDQNPLGSFKSRAFAYRMALLAQQGVKRVVLSSSGNAALSAAAYGALHQIEVVVLLSSRTHRAKVKALLGYPNARVAFSSRPMRMANYLAAHYKWPNLRTSLDPLATQGYRTIAVELAKQIGRIDQLFTFVTSGSSLAGIAQGFEMLQKQGSLKQLPRLHAVQTPGKDYLRVPSTSVGQAVSANLGTAHSARESEIRMWLERTRGMEHTVSAVQIESAHAELTHRAMDVSWEAEASWAALRQALQDRQLKGNVVVILSGKHWPEEVKEPLVRLPSIDTFGQADDWASAFVARTGGQT